MAIIIKLIILRPAGEHGAARHLPHSGLRGRRGGIGNRLLGSNFPETVCTDRL